MAQMDVKASIQSIPFGGSLIVQPPPGEEWVIHNIYYTQGVQIKINEGGSSVIVETDSTAGARLGTIYHLTNTHYMEIVSTAASGANFIGYDGVQTK